MNSCCAVRDPEQPRHVLKLSERIRLRTVLPLLMALTGTPLIADIARCGDPALLVAPAARAAQGVLRRRRRELTRQPTLGHRPQPRTRGAAARADPARTKHDRGPDRLDAFTARIPATLTSAHAYLHGARPHTFTCLDPAQRQRLAHPGGPEFGTGVLERLMRELNGRTDIGSSRWSTAGLRDLLTVQTARLLGHPARDDLKRTSHPSSTIPFRLQKFNET